MEVNKIIEKLIIEIKSNDKLSLDDQIKDIERKYFIRKYGKEGN